MILNETEYYEPKSGDVATLRDLRIRLRRPLQGTETTLEDDGRTWHRLSAPASVPELKRFQEYVNDGKPVRLVNGTYSQRVTVKDIPLEDARQAMLSEAEHNLPKALLGPIVIAGRKATIPVPDLIQEALMCLALGEGSVITAYLDDLHNVAVCDTKEVLRACRAHTDAVRTAHWRRVGQIKSAKTVAELRQIN